MATKNTLGTDFAFILVILEIVPVWKYQHDRFHEAGEFVLEPFLRNHLRLKNPQLENWDVERTVQYS